MKKLLFLFLVEAIARQAAGQNVGIGVPAPAEKLDVAGNVKANSFKYTSPRTNFYVVPAALFQKQAESDNIERYGSGIFYNNPTTNPMLASIILPQGATITSFTAYFFDNAPAADLQVFLVFNNFLGFSQAIASVSSAGNPNVLGSASTNNINAPVVVNHQTGTYSIEAYSINGAGWPGPDLQLKAVIITYTMAETS